jgi:hypothetical protein
MTATYLYSAGKWQGRSLESFSLIQYPSIMAAAFAPGLSLSSPASVKLRNVVLGCRQLKGRHVWRVRNRAKASPLRRRVYGCDMIPSFNSERLLKPIKREHQLLRFGAVVGGTPKDLNPVVRDEAYRIAAEALRNAIRHADAKRIEVEIRYDPEHLILRIRYDGRGIDEGVLDKEHAPGHWGLPGMRERAKLIGGSFEIWSKPASGAEIELKIPAATAYTKPTASRGSFFSRISRR